MDYSIYPGDEEVPGQGIVLKKARKAQSPGGVLSTNVQPGSDTVLPNARRARLRQLQEQAAALESAEPDIGQLQEFARQQGQAGEAAMLNALAAQYAGESFQPVQAQFLRRAAAARDPMKIGGGMLTPDGQFIRDPFKAQADRLSRLDRLIGAEQDDITAEERAEQARLDRLDARARRELESDRNFMLQQQLAQFRMSGGGQQRAPAGYQWTTTADGQPALTFVPGGPADPATKAAGAPTEDERKAAGWFFQADNAMRNMSEILRKAPGATDARVAERIVGFVPGVGQDLANMIRPEERQKFLQAAESMSEALLRAATGAAITKQETDQKLRELIPQIGDTPGNVKQKLDSYKVYMDSLRARAGRALPQGAGAAAPTADNDPLGLRGR